MTNKTLEFNKYNNIYYSFDLDNMINLINNQNIIFNDITFDINKLDDLLENIETSKNNKLLSIWGIYESIYDNFIKIYNLDDIEYCINYIVDQIEYNILKSIDTKDRYGIYIKIKNLLNCNKIEKEFIKIITDIDTNIL